MWDLWDIHLWPAALYERCVNHKLGFQPRAPLQRGLNRRVLEHPTVCCCFPLRTAVFLSALCTALLSLALLGSRDVVGQELRVFTGGYALQSKVIVDLVEISGIVWGTLGVFGVVFLRASYVRTYMSYQMFRLFIWLVMYFTDVPFLWSCELWRTDLKEAAKQYGWNDVMYSIAMSGQCQQERTLFVTCSTFSLFFFLYLTIATQWLLNDLEDEPRYLLKVPAGCPSGAFYTTSLAGGARAPQQLGQGSPPPGMVGPAIGLPTAGAWPGAAPHPGASGAYSSCSPSWSPGPAPPGMSPRVPASSARPFLGPGGPFQPAPPGGELGLGPGRL